MFHLTQQLKIYFVLFQNKVMSFPCHFCGLEFPKRRYLRDHMRKKHRNFDIESDAADVKVTNELMKEDVQAFGEKEKNEDEIEVADSNTVYLELLKTQGKPRRMKTFKRKSKLIQIHDVRSQAFWATWKRSPSLSGR